MPLDSDRVQALVRAELARINDRAVALAIERLLVPPSAVDRGWDYGSPGQTHTCWTVLEHPSSNTAIAFCEHGFGPSDPWGIVSIRGPNTTMGMDAAWFHTLEGAFRESPACEFDAPDALLLAHPTRYPSHVAQPLPIPPPGFDDLSAEEKLRYVNALWERVVAEQDALPISDAQRVLLRERLAAHRANPDAARPWSEAKRDIEALLQQRPPR